ncbi:MULTISPECIES: SA1362 family protein [unclassified Exiguobacterium]|uniref:SA1362 family protein n=1 Tax=unclassified Exiguobacterium TaxID=2644629 RepID=UPI001BE8A7D4|nr:MULTISPECIES: SA1362 family protein [unclassified Exiguobacterium]
MIRQRIGTTAATIVFILGFIGVGHMLATDPGRLFRQLLFIGIFGLIFYVIYRVFMAPKISAEDMRYRKTAQASKKRMQRPGANPKVKPSATTKKKAKPGSNVTKLSKRPAHSTHRSDAPHLTVIEGKKGKKKKKANM